MVRRKQTDGGENPKPEKKSRRRGKGEGTVFYREDRKQWVAQITLDDGTRKAYYFKTEKEAIEKKTQLLYEMKQGILATGKQQKLRDYLEQWLEEVHRPTVRLSTYLNYRRNLDKHILPALGNIQVQKLTPQTVQAFYASKMNSGLKARTIHLFHAILHKALDNAVRWNLVSRNVCSVVSLPRLQKYEVHPLTPEQANALLEVARGKRLEAILTVALITGMRRGELLGLRWQDINFEQRSLQVQRSVSRLPGHGFIESEPKTASGRRNITLPPVLIEVLKQHRTHQKETRLKAGSTWVEQDIVFCTRHGGFIDQSYLRQLFESLLKESGLPHIRFHDLRHSAATILLTLGIHPKVVQELLGHSTVSMTMDIYSHVLPSLQEDTMEKMGEVFKRQQEPS